MSYNLTINVFMMLLLTIILLTHNNANKHLIKALLAIN